MPPPKIKGAVGARVRAKIRSRVYSLRRCHRKVLEKNPKAKGSVKISFLIMNSGRTSNVRVTGTPAATLACIKAKVARWHLGQVPKQTDYGPFTIRFTVAP